MKQPANVMVVSRWCEHSYIDCPMVDVTPSKMKASVQRFNSARLANSNDSIAHVGDNRKVASILPHSGVTDHFPQAGISGLIWNQI